MFTSTLLPPPLTQSWINKKSKDFAAYSDIKIQSWIIISYNEMDINQDMIKEVFYEFFDNLIERILHKNIQAMRIIEILLQNRVVTKRITS